MELSDLDLSKKYSYADYLMWQFKERVEIIKGQLFNMSPAPSRKHQKIAGILNFEVHSYFNHKTCEVYPAPFDVRLSKKESSEEQVWTVVQPDLCVVCDLEKLDDRGCLGAPDLVVEILSPGNSKREMREKYEIYEESGVKEYWLVNYQEGTVLVYILNENGRFIGLQPYTEDQELTSHLFPELSIDLKNVFTD